MKKYNLTEELKKIQTSNFARKTDAQLWSYEERSRLYKSKNKGKQPKELRKYNSAENRSSKLDKQKVQEIREKYVPHVYGKQRLAREYGVSTSVIFRILKGQSWKT